MSAILNGEFHLAETWTILGYARDHQTRPLDLTAGLVEFRLAHSNGQVMLDLSSPATGTITDEANGQYEFIISPSQQTDANVTPGVYRYEVRASVASGRVSVQNKGSITVLPSLFQA